MAVPYHTHDFEIPIATKDDVVAGVSNSKALTPASVGNAASRNVEDFATAEQGVKASTAVQPDDLAKVATSGDYDDLNNRPTLGTVASHDISEVATAAQGALADTAVQPHDIGTAASHDEADFASADQGAKADSSVQPDDLAKVATSGDYNDLDNRPTLGTAASHNETDFASAAQGSKADSALQESSVGSAAFVDVEEFATAVQGERADSAVQPGSLKGLAYKDKVAVNEIDATGELAKETFLAGDGSWRNPNVGNSAFYASGDFKTVPNPSTADAINVQFTATSTTMLVSAILEVKKEINYNIQIYIYVKDTTTSQEHFIGQGMLYASTFDMPRQACVMCVYSDLILGRIYRAHVKLFTVDQSSNDPVTTYISGGCI